MTRDEARLPAEPRRSHISVEMHEPLILHCAICNGGGGAVGRRLDDLIAACMAFAERHQHEKGAGA